MRLADGTLEPEAMDGPEYAIRLGEQTIVGPGWRGPDEVIDSFHAFGVTRVYGTLVYRDTPQCEWREV
jgi:hypothetical protein